MDKANVFWQTYLNLEKELLDLSRYVYFSDTNHKINSKTKKEVTEANSHLLETYSPYIADLLVRCCVEIEALSKELYFDNGGTKARGDKDLYFDTDCIALLNQKWIIDNKVVVVSAANFNFEQDENKYIVPLCKANERSKAYWAKAYQAVKHDRYNSLHMGNIKALLQAMAALYLLNVYYRDLKFSTKLIDATKLDMSMGSNAFSLKPPSQEAAFNAINGVECDDLLHAKDSPYIVKFTDYWYKQLTEAKRDYLNQLKDYWTRQPELQEPDFVQQLMKAKELEAKDPRQRVIPLWELCKYRLNKRLPSNMSFEERKKAFVQSPEWSGRIRKQNKHISEEELTEQNLQAEIDSAGNLAGMELQSSFEQPFFIKAFNEAYCEVVLDKGNIRYIDK